MKQVKFFTTMLAITLFTSSVMQSAPSTTQINQLKQIFINDDATALEALITNKINWTSLSPLYYPAHGDSVSPFAAAVWYGATNCIQTFMTHNLFNEHLYQQKSKNGFTPLEIAQDQLTYLQRHAGATPYKNQTIANYKAIIKMLD